MGFPHLLLGIDRARRALQELNLQFFEALEIDRDRSVFLMFATSGLRPSELLSVTVLQSRGVINATRPIFSG